MPTIASFLAGCLGVLLLLLSLVWPWFHVPMNGHGITEPAATWIFRWMVFGTLTGAAAAYWRSVHARQLAARGLAVMTALLLFYPYCVMVWSPQHGVQASWLQTQHDNLTWLAGDIYNAQEYKGLDWKSRIYVADATGQVGVFKLPNWAPSTVQWGRLPEIIEWLGYSNRFCQFAGRGWMSAIAGAVFLIAALCRERATLDPHLARRVVQTMLATVGIGLPLALTPPLVAACALTRARDAVQRGHYRESTIHLERAARILPVIRRDTYFAAQQGLLENALGENTPAARLHRARALEGQGFLEQAFAVFNELVQHELPGSTVHREAVRGLVRSAIRDLNSGGVAPAMDTLQRVLSAEPRNLKANYTLQIACLRSHRWKLLEQTVIQMEAVYDSFNTRGKKAVLASGRENLCYAAYLRGDTSKALLEWRRSTGHKP